MAKQNYYRSPYYPYARIYEGGGFAEAFNKENIGGTMGGIGSGVASIANSFMSNAKIADTSAMQGKIDALSNTQFSNYGTTDSLSNAWNNTSLLSNTNYKDVRGLSGGSAFSNILSGTIGGATAGATVGGGIPGAIIGGVAGLAGGIGGLFTGNAKAKKEVSRLNEEINLANLAARANFGNAAGNLHTNQAMNLLANYSKFGGPINTFKDGGSTKGKSKKSYEPSKEIILFIKDKEGFKDRIYNDNPNDPDNGTLTIGYGFTDKSILDKYKNKNMSLEDADHYLNQEILKRLGEFERRTPNFDKLSQNQKDALFSYYYNYPGNWNPKTKMIKALKEEDWEGVANNIDAGYNDKNLKGLRIRRDEERAIFRRGNTDFTQPRNNDYFNMPRLNYDITNPNIIQLLLSLDTNTSDSPNYKLSELTPQPLMNNRETLISPLNPNLALSSFIQQPVENLNLVDKYGQTLSPIVNANENLMMYGGHTHGTEWDNGLTFFNEGGTHEENPYGGIMIGVDEEGVPNMVEEGEVKWNDYIFSNSINAKENDLDMMKLNKKYKNKSFADIAKKIGEESEERPNDPISQLGLTDGMMKLMSLQEMYRQELGMGDTMMNTFDGGGWTTYKNYETIGDDWYDDDYISFVDNLSKDTKFGQEWTNRINSGEFGNIGGNKFDIPNIQRLARDNKKGPVHNAIYQASRGWRNPQPTNPTQSTNPAQSTGTPATPPVPSSTPNTFNNPLVNIASNAILEASKNLTSKKSTEHNIPDPRSHKGEWMRYAPIVGSGLGLASNIAGLINGPDYSHADELLSYASQITDANRGDITFKPIGDYMTYNPLDRDYHGNQLRALAGATRRGIVDFSGGNRATAMSGLVASDYNTMLAHGNLARQAKESNLEQLARVSEFNRATNMFNSEGDFKAQQLNKSLKDSRSDRSIRAYMAAAEMKLREDLMRNASLSANLTNLFDNIGNLGRENYARNQINWEIDRGLHGGYSLDDIFTRKGTNYASNYKAALAAGYTEEELKKAGYGKKGKTKKYGGSTKRKGLTF